MFTKLISKDHNAFPKKNILIPMKTAQGVEVREKLALLRIDQHDVDAAIKWAREMTKSGV